MALFDAAWLVVLSMGSVGLWTLRVAVAAQGRKALSAAVAAFEAIVFAVTFSHVVNDLARPDRLIGYAIGVAMGTLLGLTVTERLTHGVTEIQVFAPGHDLRLVHQLHEQGWPATWYKATGPEGDVTVVMLTVDGSRVGDVLKELADTPRAFWTTRDVAGARPAASPRCRARRRRRRLRRSNDRDRVDVSCHPNRRDGCQRWYPPRTADRRVTRGVTDSETQFSTCCPRGLQASRRH